MGTTANLPVHIVSQLNPFRLRTKHSLLLKTRQEVAGALLKQIAENQGLVTVLRNVKVRVRSVALQFALVYAKFMQQEICNKLSINERP
jgi:hypothetical protein